MTMINADQRLLNTPYEDPLLEDLRKSVGCFKDMSGADIKQLLLKCDFGLFKDILKKEETERIKVLREIVKPTAIPPFYCEIST